MLLAPNAEAEAPPPPPPPAPRPIGDLMQRIATPQPVPEMPEMDDAQQDAITAGILAEIAAEDSRSSLALLFQDYQLRSRMRGAPPTLAMAAFRDRYALARVGIDESEDWEATLELTRALPEEMLIPFLGLARSARNGLPCPSDEQLAALYGTSSLGRAKRMLAFIEEKGLIVCRTDLSGKRSISLPHLGWTTGPGDAGEQPSRLSRIGRAGARERLRDRA
jgi:hypothetical protein